MITRLRQAFPYLLLAPAVLPLIYIGGILYPYVAPKTFLLQSLGIFALAAFAFLALTGQAFFYNRLRTPLSWIPAVLLGIEYAASLFGIGFYHSFWGLFERGDGLLTYTVITIFFYLILLSADRIFLNRLVKTIAVVAGIVASVAVLQWVTTILGEKVWFLPPVTGRIGSTLGNAAFLAGYLGMSLFVILIVFSRASGLWRRVYKAAAILSVLAIVFAATRGTILALLVAAVAALVFFSWKGKGEMKKSAQYGLAALAIFAGLFFVFRAELSQVSFEPIRRIASISLSEGTVGSRLFVWSHVTEEALQNPLQGYGAEHIAQLFDRIYDPSAIVEQWFDRSHNAFLDYFAQYGILGLASYLALLFAFALSAYRLYKREENSTMNPGFLFLLFILTYVIQNLFVFDTPSSLWLLYALFALLLVELSDVSATSVVAFRKAAIPAAISGLIVLLAIPAVILPFSANVFLTRGYLLHLTEVNKANAYFERGLALNTYADLEYGYQAYEMYTGHQAPTLVGKDRIAAYEYALSVLSANFKKYPYDARTATYLGHVMDTVPPELSADESFQRQVLTSAIALSPMRAQAWYMLANIALWKADSLPQGDMRKEVYFREAIAVLEEYAQKEENLSVPRYILATLYYKLDDKAAAKKWADEAYSLYLTPDAAAAAPAVKYYLAIGDWQHAVRFLADLVADDPTDTDILYDLAKVTYLAGDLAASERIVEKLRAENPAILSTDPNFLAAITAYEQSRQ